jgi:hypothetical protein
MHELAAYIQWLRREPEKSVGRRSALPPLNRKTGQAYLSGGHAVLLRVARLLLGTVVSRGAGSLLRSVSDTQLDVGEDGE